MFHREDSIFCYTQLGHGWEWVDAPEIIYLIDAAYSKVFTGNYNHLVSQSTSPYYWSNPRLYPE